MENKPKKYSKGRQKIEIKKIEKKSYLNVTFSKRRSGLFSKAGKLSVLCGAQVAVLVNSPAGKLYTFGSPSADAVIHRFLAGNSYSSTHEDELGVQQLNMNKYVEALGQLEAKLEQEKSMKNGVSGFWWDEPIDNLGLNELHHYITSLEVLKNNVVNQAHEKAMAMASASLPNVVNQVDEKPMASASPSNFMALGAPLDPFNYNLVTQGTSFGGFDYMGTGFGY